MTEAPASSRFDRFLYVFSAVVGTLPPALLAAMVIARFVPLRENDGFALGFTLALPLWAGAMWAAFQAKSGKRAFAWCLATSALFGALVYLAS